MYDDIVIFDTETTGLLKPNANDLNEQPYITEFYGVRLNEEYQIVNEYETFIKPKVDIPAEVTNITGITNQMVEDAPHFIEVYDGIAELFLGARKVVAHNLSFDRDMLFNELARHDLQLKFPWPIDHYCTVENSLHIKGWRLSLTQLHKLATGEPHHSAHRAKEDVHALVRCYHWLTEVKNATSIDTDGI